MNSPHLPLVPILPTVPKSNSGGGIRTPDTRIMIPLL
jgi:hypothetical protein